MTLELSNNMVIVDLGNKCFSRVLWAKVGGFKRE